MTFINATFIAHIGKDNCENPTKSTDKPFGRPQNPVTGISEATGPCLGKPSDGTDKLLRFIAEPLTFILPPLRFHSAPFGVTLPVTQRLSDISENSLGIPRVPQRACTNHRNGLPFPWQTIAASSDLNWGTEDFFDSAMTHLDPRLTFASRTKSEVRDEVAVDDAFLWWVGVLDRFTSLAAAVEHCCTDGAGHRFVGLGGVAGASGGGRP